MCDEENGFSKSQVRFMFHIEIISLHDIAAELGLRDQDVVVAIGEDNGCVRCGESGF